MRDLLAVLLWLIWLGGAVCCLIALHAAWRFCRAVAATRQPDDAFLPPLSLLKPLSGLENGLERNLESFFNQDYPRYEIIFAVNDAEDPALALVSSLREKYPHVPVKIVDASQGSYPNAKVYSLEMMAGEASADILVISDSDVFVNRDYLRGVVRPFADPRVGVSTCLYRGVPGRSLWSRLEALGMSTEFMAGVLLAWQVEGMKFALGPTMIVRRECLEAIGGFRAMADYLADDFVLGQWAAQAGYQVTLSSYIINHQVLGESFAATFAHRLRWARSSRFSRPWGYLGQAFTYPIAIALMLAALSGFSTLSVALLIATVGLRCLVALAVGWGVLRDRWVPRGLWLVPLQDLVSFAVWCCGFTGRHVKWRHTLYRVYGDGRFAPADNVEPWTTPPAEALTRDEHARL